MKFRLLSISRGQIGHCRHLKTPLLSWFRFTADLVAERGLEWRISMHERKTIDLDQGWEFMQKGITKLKNIFGGAPRAALQLMFYTAMYRVFNGYDARISILEDLITRDYLEGNKDNPTLF